MGYSIAWIAVRGASLDTVLAVTGLERTSARAEFASEPFTGQQLGDGWQLLAADSCDSHLISNKVLASLVDCQVIACSVEEHVMFSSTAYWQNGRCEWSAEHASEQGLRHLTTQGSPPVACAEYLAEAKRLQEQDSEVDYFFEVPLLLARDVCGFKHDEDYAGLDYEHFSVYDRNRGFKKWWQVWRSA